MNYEQTLEFLFSQLPAYHRIGKAAYKNDLHNTIVLDNYFGNPHLKFKTIHVAGTNGKGSVSHMVASILQEAGYKTGLYTSPHLKDFRERIKINGTMIPEYEIVTFVTNHKEIIDTIKPSFFEMTVAMAFNYFAACSVDVAVIEVGLGGRLDSTNIIKPVLSVITNIGHDHMDLLGNTFEKIASEKAGIIKNEVPVVISETQPETKEVFISKTFETGSAISFADERYSCNLYKTDNQAGERRYLLTDIKTGKRTEGISILGGDYQEKNLKSVFCACENLKEIFNISDNNIVSGIRNVVKNTGLEGRWQILSHDPLTICDTGHNKEGLEYVLNQLHKIEKSKLHMVIGFVSDKDIKSVLPLFPQDATYYFTKASVPRALNEEILKAEAANYGLSGNSFPDVKTAINSARRNAKKSDVIFIGGSTFIVAEAV
jgi:dihydrofolate synthase / folylpolyglutamate synthase